MNHNTIPTFAPEIHTCKTEEEQFPYEDQLINCQLMSFKN